MTAFAIQTIQWLSRRKWTGSAIAVRPQKKKVVKEQCGKEIWRRKYCQRFSVVTEDSDSTSSLMETSGLC